MKKIPMLTLTLLLIPLAAAAQEATGLSGRAKVRGVWDINPLPVAGYNTDLGFQLGAACSFACYGDGSVWPDYFHRFDIEASYYFRGAGLFHAFYDSKYLIPKIRFTAAATYTPNPIMNFYGFGGAPSPHHSSMDRKGGIAFYSMKRNMLRVVADFQGGITGPLEWIGGIAFRYYKTDEVSLKKYRDGADFSLYNLYREYGVIDRHEATGGSHLELKAGLAYDTREQETVPCRGIRAEAMIYGSPDIFHGRDFDYLKIAAHFRHYVPLWEDRIIFAYHLACQWTIAGKAPFYIQSNIDVPYTSGLSSEGLGGAYTLRGMLHNRIVGSGIAWGNTELRIRLAKFNVMGQQWYVAVNPFFDAGMVVQPYRLDEMKAAETAAVTDGLAPGLIYSGRKEKLHMSAGVGIKLAMDKNFLLSVEWAKPLDRQDGKNGVNAGLNYIF